MKLYFDDVNFDGQLQRTVGKCDTGMANVGECLYIASQITPGDRDSWYREWSSFAGRLADQGDEALAAGHRVSARDCYLRACEYFRQAFFWHRDDLDGVELTTAYAASVSAFHRALPLLDHRATILEGDTPGYLDRRVRLAGAHASLRDAPIRRVTMLIVPEAEEPASSNEGCGRAGQRSVRKNARMSSARRWGCSIWAKWPPRGMSVQCRRSYLRATVARGTCITSWGKAATPVGHSIRTGRVADGGAARWAQYHCIEDRMVPVNQ
jgi:hypothetical protein